ncbi:MAG TPA: DNA primase [Gammaproteobacteria bacterium]|nr:DNA primase [Gammaproteobacteria bacterium]
MPRIPQHFIDDILARTDIVELIDARVQLKKKGHEFAACCPFHTEKTPSFYVSPAKQFYHCFGCGAHGTAISFLMEFEHLEFPDAIRQLADQAGLEVPEEAGNAQRESSTAPLYGLMQQAGEFYKGQLKAAPRAIDYLKQRGVSGEIAAQFGLGFAPAEWDALTNKLGIDKTGRDQLVTTGMAIRKDNGSVYDRFRDRVMFPIRDARGRTIGFGGRVLGKDEPKYLNSPETPLFHKGRELYGLYEARQALRNITQLVVVEGYMDVLALAQHGIRYAVATLGTATTVEHLNRLFRICPEIIFCFDGDRAGRQAAWRALENALPAIHDGRQIRFLFLPDGEDPDSMVRAQDHNQGQPAFEKQLAQAVSLSDYLLNELAANTDMNSVDGRARLVDQARPLLKRLPDPVYRAMLEQKLARLAQLPADQLTHLLASSAEQPKSAAQPSASRRSNLRLALTPARRAIMLLLNQPALASQATHLDTLDEVAALNIIPGLPPLLELIRYFQVNPNASAAQAIEHWRDEALGGHLARLAQQPLESPVEGWEADFNGLLAGFVRRGTEQRLDILRSKDFRDLSPAEKTELQNLLKS